MKNLRQESRPEKMAGIEIRRGNADKAIERLGQLGKVTVSPNRSEAVRELVSAWAKAGGVELPQDHMIFTHTRREAQIINQLCQSERQRNRNCRGTKSIKVGECRLTEGDRVIFYERIPSLHIENGRRATVIDASMIRQTVTIRLDEPRRIRKTGALASAVVTVPIRELPKGALTLSFAATTAKMQGQTIPHSWILATSETNKELAYTQFTRGKIDTHVFVGADEAGENLKDLKKAMKKSIAKDLAHDVVDQAKREGRRPPPLPPDGNRPVRERREVRLPKQGQPAEPVIRVVPGGGSPGPQVRTDENQLSSRKRHVSLRKTPNKDEQPEESKDSAKRDKQEREKRPSIELRREISPGG